MISQRDRKEKKKPKSLGTERRFKAAISQAITGTNWFRRRSKTFNVSRNGDESMMFRSLIGQRNCNPRTLLWNK